MAAQATKRKPTRASKVDAPDLSHLIPPEEFGPVGLGAGEYVSRKIKGIRDIDLMKYAMSAHDNVLLFGPTGPGKTSMVLAYAVVEQLPVVTVQCNGAVDPNTFWGGLAFDEDGTLKGWQDSEVTEVIEHGGVLYMDEINFLHPKVAAVWHGLLDKRRQIVIPELGNRVIKASPNLVIVAAYNPDYEGTKPLNPAFKNRWRHKVKFDYDEKIERELLCVPVMVEAAHKLRLSHKAGDIDTPVSTNMLIEFEILAVDLGYDYAVENFLNAFAEEERQSVGEVLDAMSKDIKAQVKEMADA